MIVFQYLFFLLIIHGENQITGLHIFLCELGRFEIYDLNPALPDQICCFCVYRLRKSGIEIIDLDRKSTRLNSSHEQYSRMPSSA